MTAPVIIKVNDSASMWQSTNYVLSFLLPSSFQANPPKPTDSSVSLRDILCADYWTGRIFYSLLMILTSTLFADILHRHSGYERVRQKLRGLDDVSCDQITGSESEDIAGQSTG